jgi:hypothetical protein
MTELDIAQKDRWREILNIVPNSKIDNLSNLFNSSGMRKYPYNFTWKYESRELINLKNFIVIP